MKTQNKTQKRRQANQKKLKSKYKHLNNFIYNYMVKVAKKSKWFNNFPDALRSQGFILKTTELVALNQFAIDTIEKGKFDDTLLRNLINKINYIDAVARFNGHKIKMLIRKHKEVRLCKRDGDETYSIKTEKKTAKEILSQYKDAKTIGLGVETEIKIPRIRREDVKIDVNTEKKKKVEKAILYAAGWTLDGAVD